MRLSASTKIVHFALAGICSLSLAVIVGLVVLWLDEDKSPALQADRPVPGVRKRPIIVAERLQAPVHQSKPPALALSPGPESPAPPAFSTPVDAVETAGAERAAATADPAPAPPPAVGGSGQERTVDRLAASPPANKPESLEVAAASDSFELPEAVAESAAKESWFAGPGSVDATDQASGPVRAKDRSLQTALSWRRSPEEAAAEARREAKLVFLIHVSGNFEDPGFT